MSTGVERPTGLERTLERVLERVLEQMLGQMLGQALTGPSVTAGPARTAVPLLSWGGMTARYTSTAPAALVAWPSQHRAARTGTEPAALTEEPTDAEPTDDGPESARPEGTEPAALTEELVGAGLVGVLERVEVADLDDALLLDVAARWQQ
ncbi:hypothetical protein ACIG47_07985, partial [Promicromonospora sp. NPDC052451]|uniref:hypothetical protein n=1 Tax=Promicromonospora sp. NPDC052451 TaxID=3364407 RepID=UPI0037C6396B